MNEIRHTVSGVDETTFAWIEKIRDENKFRGTAAALDYVRKHYTPPSNPITHDANVDDDDKGEQAGNARTAKKGA